MHCTITYTDPATHPITFATPTFPGVNWMDGIIDEIRIYNRVLTPEEIAALAVERPRVTLSPNE